MRTPTQLTTVDFHELAPASIYRKLQISFTEQEKKLYNVRLGFFQHVRAAHTY